MKLSLIEESLFRSFRELEVVDAHEHLPPEKVRLEQKVDALTLFDLYPKFDLLSSGMPQEYLSGLYDPAIPIEKRWEMFAPYLKNIRYGSYARPAFIAAREFYGFDDINERNYKALSEKMGEFNTTGIYNRVLRDKCRIRVALTQKDLIEYDADSGWDSQLLLPLMPLDMYAAVRSKRFVEERAIKLGTEVKTLDDYLELVRVGLVRWKSEGVVGLKARSFPYHPYEREQAVAAFDKLMRSEKEVPPESVPTRKLFPEKSREDLKLMNSPLYIFLLDEILDMAVELDLVVAVHTGMWADFRVIDSQHMIPILSKHPKTRFDIYHMGMPYVRETEIIGKNFPNVWLNLCWCHLISQRIACQALDELIDLVPMNKIIAFGGDYELQVENVYGHLLMAQEDIAKVLGHRVEDGLMTENEAVDVAKRWFYENPKELYELNL